MGDSPARKVTEETVASISRLQGIPLKEEWSKDPTAALQACIAALDGVEERLLTEREPSILFSPQGTGKLRVSYALRNRPPG